MRTLLALLLVAAAPAPGAAQDGWSGGAAIGLKVTDKAGAPLPGARVTLRATALEPPAGPPPLLTDREGQAAFTGLREGEWYLEIEHPDHMRFTAYLEARARKAPKSTFSAQLATPSSWVPMRVAFHRPRGPAGLPAPDARAARPASAEPVAPAPAAPPRQPLLPPAPQAAPPPPPAAPVPSPPPPLQPVAPVPLPPAVAAPELAPPTPPPPVAEEGSEPAEPEPAPPPEPGPAPEPPASAPPPSPPQAVAGPLAPPAPPPRRAPVEFGPRVEGCPECRAGESALAAAAATAPGGAGCPAGLAAEARAALDAAARGVESPEPSTGALADVLMQLEGAGGPPTPPPAGADGSCAVVAVVLPPGARFLAYRFEARDERAAGDCLADQECPIGEARWLEHAALLRAGSLQIVYGVFENRHRERARTARLTVYYRSRPSWAPAPSPPPR